MAFLPWIINYIKSLEIFGIGKVELVTKEIKEKTENAIEKIENKNSNKKLMNSVEVIDNFDDPIFKLAIIRIEAEKYLNKIAKNNKINQQYPNKNLAQLLFKNSIISENEYVIIRNLWPILNKAIHSDLRQLNPTEIEWSITTGLFILNRLEILANIN